MAQSSKINSTTKSPMANGVGTQSACQYGAENENIVDSSTPDAIQDSNISTLSNVELKNKSYSGPFGIWRPVNCIVNWVYRFPQLESTLIKRIEIITDESAQIKADNKVLNCHLKQKAALIKEHELEIKNLNDEMKRMRRKHNESISSLIEQHDNCLVKFKRLAAAIAIFSILFILVNSLEQAKSAEIDLLQSTGTDKSSELQNRILDMKLDHYYLMFIKNCLSTTLMALVAILVGLILIQKKLFHPLEIVTRIDRQEQGEDETAEQSLTEVDGLHIESSPSIDAIMANQTSPAGILEVRPGQVVNFVVRIRNLESHRKYMVKQLNVATQRDSSSILSSPNKFKIHDLNWELAPNDIMTLVHSMSIDERLEPGEYRLFYKLVCSDLAQRTCRYAEAQQVLSIKAAESRRSLEIWNRFLRMILRRGPPPNSD